MINSIITLFVLFSPLSALGTDLKELTTQLKNLVEINSGTNNVSGVERVQAWIASELKDLGFKVEISAPHLLIATLRGVEPGITLVGHADTVFEPSSPFQLFKLSDDGLTATGPGIIDDKGGVLVAIEGLRRFLAHHKPTHTLRFVISPSEETGSPGLTETFRKLSLKTWLVLGFEPSLEDGSYIDTRRGNRWYEIMVKGKEAHAGRDHKNGVNACHELATKLAKISKLTNYAKDLTVSIGHIEGGQDKFNIVCGEAHAKIDTRFSTFKDRDWLHRQVESISKQVIVPGTETTLAIRDDSPPFSPTVESTALAKNFVQAIQTIEHKQIKGGKSGGSADANYFSRPGILIIDGFGPVGGKMHTEEEFIYLPSLNTRADVFRRFLESLK